MTTPGGYSLAAGVSNCSKATRQQYRQRTPTEGTDEDIDEDIDEGTDQGWSWPGDYNRKMRDHVTYQ